MEFQAASGAKVAINAAPFRDVLALKAAIGKSIAASSVTLEVDPAKRATEQDFDVAEILKLAALVDSDAAVQECLEKCLARCTYNNEKITLDGTFEPEEARQDYYEVVTACLKVNLSPFFDALLTKLSPVADMMAKVKEEKSGGQKQE